MSKRTDPRVGRSPRVAPASPFLPMLLVSMAVVGFLLFETWEVYQERAVIAEQRAKQAPAFREAERLQRQLEGIAAGTARLARAGNPNAQLIIDALRARGITIDPDSKRR